jgi:hypothetical protein
LSFDVHLVLGWNAIHPRERPSVLRLNLDTAHGFWHLILGERQRLGFSFYSWMFFSLNANLDVKGIQVAFVTS